MRLIALTVLVTAVASAWAGNSPAQTQDVKRFDLRIENNRLVGNLKTVRVSRSDVVEIAWSTDRHAILHLHGYDIETIVEPDKPQIMSFTARATGRFPIEMHGVRHTVVLYLEVHPR